jgi:hypothetical protein
LEVSYSSLALHLGNESLLKLSIALVPYDNHLFSPLVAIAGIVVITGIAIGPFFQQSVVLCSTVPEFQVPGGRLSKPSRRRPSHIQESMSPVTTMSTFYGLNCNRLHSCNKFNALASRFSLEKTSKLICKRITLGSK